MSAPRPSAARRGIDPDVRTGILTLHWDGSATGILLRFCFAALRFWWYSPLDLSDTFNSPPMSLSLSHRDPTSPISLLFWTNQMHQKMRTTKPTRAVRVTIHQLKRR